MPSLILDYLSVLRYLPYLILVFDASEGPPVESLDSSTMKKSDINFGRKGYVAKVLKNKEVLTNIC